MILSNSCETATQDGRRTNEADLGGTFTFPAPPHGSIGNEGVTFTVLALPGEDAGPEDLVALSRAQVEREHAQGSARLRGRRARGRPAARAGFALTYVAPDGPYRLVQRFLAEDGRGCMLQDARVGARYAGQEEGVEVIDA